MPRGYAITLNGTITNSGGDTDLFSGQAGDDVPIRYWGQLLSQISEVGDTAEEGLRITVKYFPATWTVGSGGNSVSAISPCADPAGSAWSMTARTNDTTVGTTNGTALVRKDLGWNERNTPYDFFFPNDMFAPMARQGAALVCRQETTAADDYTGCFTFWVEEPS